MRYRIETEEYPDSHTIDGVTAQVTRTRRVAVPVLPPDVEALAVRAVVGLVLGLTLVSVTWSTVSIAHLLRGSWVAYLAGAVFDLAWLAVLGMSYLVRYRPDRRRVVDRVGWALLAVTVAAIGVESYRTGGLAVACIGASVSVAAKALWWTFGRATRPELTAADAQWVAAQLSQASARMAVAAIRRQATRVEDQAAAQLLAMEASRRPPAGTVGAEVPFHSDGFPALPGMVTEQSGAVPAASEEGVRTSVTVPPDSPAVNVQVTGVSGGQLADSSGRRLYGAAARTIRDLVSTGVTDVPAIAGRLAVDGLAVTPDYIRRVVRRVQSRPYEPGQYL